MWGAQCAPVQAPLKRGLSPPLGGDWGFLGSRDEKPSVICSANATSLFKGGFLRGARRLGVRSARLCMAHIFVGAGPRPARLICTLGPPYIYFMGMFRRQRAASDFCHGAKVTKKPLRGRGVSSTLSPLSLRDISP